MVFKTTSIRINKQKSRRDGILLTADFNLRNVKTLHVTSLQSPAGTTLLPPHWGRVGVGLVSSLRDCWVSVSCWLLRRLKPTVNKVLSLRDSLPQTQHYYKLFIFIP